MTEINYTELNHKILEIIKREPSDFSLIMSFIPGPPGQDYEYDYKYDYAYIKFPCGWTKSLYLEFKIVNNHADKSKFVFNLRKARLQGFWNHYDLPVEHIDNHATLTYRVSEHSLKVIEKEKQKAEGISLRFNRALNKLISRI